MLKVLNIFQDLISDCNDMSIIKVYIVFIYIFDDFVSVLIIKLYKNHLVCLSIYRI